MSRKMPPAIRWALAQRVKPSTAHHLLMVLAAHGDGETGDDIFPSIATLVDLTGMNRKTVRAAFARLTDDEKGKVPLLVDTGRRAGRTASVPVYRLAMEAGPKSVPLAEVEAEPKTDPVDDDILALIDGEAGPKTVPLEVEAGPELTPVSGTSGTDIALKRDQKRPPTSKSTSILPSVDHAREASSKPDKPKAKRQRVAPSRLPDDWTPPAIADLPADLRACVETWPAGRYEKVAASFRRYWTGPDAKNPMKRDWPRTWANWLDREDERIVERVSRPSAAAAVEVKARPGEGEFGAELRRRLLAEFGGGTYGSWFAALTFTVEGATLVVAAATGFAADYVRANFAERLAAIASSVAGARLSVYVAAGRPQPANREVARLVGDVGNRMRASA